MLARPFPQAKAIGLDIETTGLDMWRDTITTIAVSDGEDTIIVDARDPDLKPGVEQYLDQWVWGLDGSATERQREIGDWLVNHVYDRLVVGHNLAFDIPRLSVWFTGSKFPTKVWDTMIAEQLLTAGLDLSASLAETTERRLGITLDKSLQTSFDGGDLTEAQLDYATQDAKVLVPLARVQHKLIQQEDLATVWEIESAVTPVVCSMIRHGVRLDGEVLRRISEETTRETEDLKYRLQVYLSPHVEWLRVEKHDAMQAELDAWLAAREAEEKRLEAQWDFLVDTEVATGDAWSQNKWGDDEIDRKDGKPKGQKRYVKAKRSEWQKENPRPQKPKLVVEPINIDGSQQLLAAFKSLGIEVEDTKEETLRNYLPDATDEQKRKVILPLLDYREKVNLRRRVKRYLEFMSPEGYVYPETKQMGAASGRFTMKEPNLHSTTKEGPLRSAILPDPGHVIVKADYSQMELRLGAELSGDPVMLDVYQRDADIHHDTAKWSFQVEEPTKDQRRGAKKFSFGIPYGLGLRSMLSQLAAEGTFLTWKEGKTALKNWHSIYSVFSHALDTWRKDSVERGYCITPLGRKRWLTFNDAASKGAAERAAGNHPLQGGNADISKLALVLAQELLEPVGGRVILVVHDELVASVPEEHVEYGKRVIQVSMEEAAKAVLKQVPVKVDVTVSRSWSEDDAIAGDVGGG